MLLFIHLKGRLDKYTSQVRDQFDFLEIVYFESGLERVHCVAAERIIVGMLMAPHRFLDMKRCSKSSLLDLRTIKLP